MPGMSASGNMSPQSTTRMRSVDLEAEAIAADLAQPAEKDDPNGVVSCWSGTYHLVTR